MKLFGLSRFSTFALKSNLRNPVVAFHCHTIRTSYSNIIGKFSSLNFCTSCVLRRKPIGGHTLRMATPALKPQYFDYFLVLDFEATCQENEQIRPQEIIEFPVLKINSKTLETEATFHQYVQPRVHKDITPFCTKLTGIIQDMVDDQPYIEEVLQKFHNWMKENKLLDPNVKSVFVICGDWDLMKMLPQQAGHFKIQTADYFKEWLNIKKAYAEVTSTYPKGMMPMLKGLDVAHQGRHHSGIDDCKNIGNILIQLLKRGYIAKVTGSR